MNLFPSDNILHTTHSSSLENLSHIIPPSLSTSSFKINHDSPLRDSVIEEKRGLNLNAEQKRKTYFRGKSKFGKTSISSY